MLFTIFTPTFNRAALLPRLYESLCRQTFRDFEWVIVDDGSTDNTAAVVDGFRGKENLFPIRYFRKVNGGKHTAINYGVQKASGELFLILDSDDELPMDSLNKIAEAWQSVTSLPAKGKQIGGICGYMAHRDGTVIGHPTINGVADSIELRYIYGVTGDMCEVFRTMVLREFPFPEIQGEKFCPEVLVWNRIATQYTLKVFQQSYLPCRISARRHHRCHYAREDAEPGGLHDDLLRDDAPRRHSVQSATAGGHQLLAFPPMPQAVHTTRAYRAPLDVRLSAGPSPSP